MKLLSWIFIMNENYCNVKKVNFDLKEIYLKNKDLSKVFQQQSHLIDLPSRKKHKHYSLSCLHL